MSNKGKVRPFLLKLLRKGLILCAFVAMGALPATAQVQVNITPTPDATPVAVPPVPACANTVVANVVAFDQIITYNRFGAFDPGGMMFALKRDVVPITGTVVGPGNAQLRGNKRPRPIALRVNEGDCLQVNFTNYLDPNRAHVEQLQFLNQPNRRPYYDRTPFFGPVETQIDGSVRKIEPLGPNTFQVRQYNTNGTVQVIDDGTVHLSQNDTPATRTASVHVNGMDYVNGIADDGSNVGKNASSLANPGQTRTYKWYAAKQGQYLIYSTAATTGGEGNGGQVDHGLFGSVNVEPKGAKWYRSQVTNAVLNAAKTGTTAKGQPIINYEATFANGDPVLNILKAGEIIYSDLNAVITDFTPQADGCTASPTSTARIDPPSGTCGQWFREFTVVFHDELETGKPAFPELLNDEGVFHSVRDGFGINYGSSGLGSILLANRKKIGPAKNCAECEFEEFFLEAWPNGDPAMLVKADPVTHVASQVLFPDDPSNVHHSYIGDPVRFRNVHAGPRETHVFHLHGHQWLQSPRDQNSTYLDSQTVSPGASFTYEINYGGTGNRNLIPGDAIFHCHLYPHFAQGMWELWRSHDVFEDGTPARNLPDGEIAAGMPTPAIIPMKSLGMPLMPSATFKGYPFYLAAVAGHRASQPPLSLDFDGGLPRHYIVQGTDIDGPAGIEPKYTNDPVHQRVVARNPDPNLRAFARDLVTAQAVFPPDAGTADEQNAMKFHDGTLFPSVVITTIYGWPARAYDTFTSAGVAAKFLVNGRPRVAGAPYADPCPPTFKPDIDNGPVRPTPLRKYRAAWIQFDPDENLSPNGFVTLKINDAGWHDRQGRITVLEQDALAVLHGQQAPEPLFFRANSGDCIDYRVTNLFQNKALNLDDFQVFQDTDIVGQHIHLVKFDVTSSDGAGNGWNYESGGFNGEATRETIEAIRKGNNCVGELSGDPRDGTNTCPVPKPHPVFGAGPNGIWVGAQTLIERWWADPLVNRNGHDRTIRTAFTHDHFSPSGHQHHGLYAGLVVEPTDSIWTNLTGTQTFGTRADGGPTSFAANIITNDQANSYREFNLEIGDFAIVYTPGLQPVNPPNRVEHDPPFIVGSVVIDDPSQKPFPEAISSADVGTEVINYRNEPIPLRIGQLVGGTFQQKAGQAGDLAYAFSSVVHGDPFTPILPAYPGDHIQVRLLQGAQEEQHVMNIHAHRWYFEPGTPHDPATVNNSGLTNSQAIGISEHFEFDFNDKVAPVFNTSGIADFLYQSAPVDNLWNGMWGLMRTYKFFHPEIIAKLPNNQSFLRGAGDPSDTSAVAVEETDAPPSPLADPNAPPPAPGQQLAVDDPNASPNPAAPDPFTSNGTKEPDEVKDGKTAVISGGGINRCPVVPGVPIKTFILEAWLAKDLLSGLPTGSKGIVYNSKFNFFDPAGVVYINAADRTAIATGAKPLEPLAIRVNAGDCVNVTLRNRLPASGISEYVSFNILPPIIPKFNFNQIAASKRLSLHPQVLLYEVSGSDGSAVGFNPDTTVGPGQSINYAWYAGKIDVNNGPTGWVVNITPAEFGVTNLRDYGDVIKHASHGAIGSLTVEPKGAQYFAVGSTTTLVNSGAKADIRASNGSLLFREFVVHYQDDVTMKSGTSGALGMRNQGGGGDSDEPAGEDDPEDSGQKAFNYRNEPIWARFGLPPETGLGTLNNLNFTNSLSSNVTSFGCGATPCDPLTPLFEAKPGTNVRFRIAQAAGHSRQHGFTVFGHHWNFEPWQNNSLVLGNNPLTFEIGSYSGFGPTRHFNILTVAGGLTRKTGDFLYRSQESFGFAGGLWGIFRVSLTAP